MVEPDANKVSIQVIGTDFLFDSNVHKQAKPDNIEQFASRRTAYIALAQSLVYQIIGNAEMQYPARRTNASLQYLRSWAP